MRLQEIGYVEYYHHKLHWLKGVIQPNDNCVIAIRVSCLDRTPQSKILLETLLNFAWRLSQATHDGISAWCRKSYLSGPPLPKHFSQKPHKPALLHFTSFLHAKNQKLFATCIHHHDPITFSTHTIKILKADGVLRHVIKGKKYTGGKKKTNSGKSHIHINFSTTSKAHYSVLSSTFNLQDIWPCALVASYVHFVIVQYSPSVVLAVRGLSLVVGKKKNSCPSTVKSSCI